MLTTVKTKPEFETTAIKKIIDDAGLSPMDIVRMCGISVTSAYKIEKEIPLSDLNVIYKVYLGLKGAGANITWGDITGIE